MPCVLITGLRAVSHHGVAIESTSDQTPPQSHGGRPSFSQSEKERAAEQLELAAEVYEVPKLELDSLLLPVMIPAWEPDGMSRTPDTSSYTGCTVLCRVHCCHRGITDIDDS